MVWGTQVGGCTQAVAVAAGVALVAAAAASTAEVWVAALTVAVLPAFLVG